MSTDPTPTALPDPNDREAMFDLVAAYAIHAVDESECAFIEAHLDDDPGYRVELGRHLVAAAAMTVEAPVPASTWEAIVARTTVADSVPLPRPDTLRSAVRTDAANVIALDAARAARRSRVRVAFAAAAASALIAVPLTLQLAGGSPTSIAALASNAAKQPGARTVVLRDPTGNVLANAVVTADGRGYLRRDTLPALPEGQAYQLWAITGATPISAGVLGRNPSESPSPLMRRPSQRSAPCHRHLASQAAQ